MSRSISSAAAVILERIAGLVRSEAVGFDGDPLGAPDEVGPDRGFAVAGIDVRVDLGRLHAGGAGDLEDLGLVEGALDGAAADDGGEVEDRAGDGGDGDGVDGGDVGWREGGRAVEVDAVMAASGPARDDDVDAGPAARTEAVEVRRYSIEGGTTVYTPR